MSSFRGTTVFTVGHSNRSIEELVELLWSAGVGTVADIRRFAGSRKFPWFGPEALESSLSDADIRYVEIAELGGRRKALPDTPNSGWRNMAFRGYADHMRTPEFKRGLAKLQREVKTAPTAIMCSEAVPWRCHRWLVSDALIVRGANVLHLVGTGKPRGHSLTAFARRRGDLLSYPPGPRAASVVLTRANRKASALSARTART
ncbi:MAG: DUF488 family protein [Myxococcaceae bacterium]